MNGNLILPSLIRMSGVLLAAFAQILLKQEAMKKHDSFIREYVNPRVILGYMITFGTLALTILAYQFHLPVAWSNVIERLEYPFVTLLSVLILREKVSPKKWAALAVIMAGILIFALG